MAHAMTSMELIAYACNHKELKVQIQYKYAICS
ncbi:hypothetical protein FBZ82_10870 [Azospirillum brasilense]|uniref:Uncharacterized protein n=1 Tax=Azospirillum brasilense TaxID=192 RepID=A0A560B198_AZOBR|nr:hypothetical protein FBZ82_10870 [Azospirillum brasilense]